MVLEIVGVEGDVEVLPGVLVDVVVVDEESTEDGDCVDWSCCNREAIRSNSDKNGS